MISQPLRFCEVESDRLTLDHFPDFLIAGPQRTGTTWLHQILVKHPQVFLSDPKELYFFSRLKEREHPRFQSAKLDWYLWNFHDPLPRWIHKQARAISRFGCLYRPLMRGEATASYAALDREVIEEIARLNPDVKVLLMLRNPVDRAWSHAKKDLVRNRGRAAGDVSDPEWHTFFRDPYQRRCARYPEIIANWQASLRPGNVFVGAFEKIRDRPEELLREVTTFLGVSCDARYVDASLLRRSVNPTGGSQVPEKFREYLEDLFTREIGDWKRLVAR